MLCMYVVLLLLNHISFSTLFILFGRICLPNVNIEKFITMYMIADIIIYLDININVSFSLHESM